MSSGTKFITHLFGGGWASDYGPSATVDVSASGKVVLPWLNEAENIFFELDGGPHKITGTAKNNSAALESGASVTGVYDAWFSGTAGTPAQHRILNVGTKIKKDNADNTFTNLFSGMTAGAVPCYTMLEDLLIISNDSGVDVPKSWDGATAQSLAGSPPPFAFSCNHINRVWAAGDIANPSRLYYCVDFTPDDWTNTGSGHIDIDPSDGDRITGIISHRNELWVYKGPNKGSIHRISGSAPTGDDPFARATFVTGMGAVNHNGLQSFGNDVAFIWSDGTIRTLSATQNFGNYDESSASEPINSWIALHVTRSVLKKAYTVNWPELGVLLFAIPIDGSTVNNCVIMMDYRFSPPRWAKWPAFNMIISMAQAVEVSSDGTKRTVIAGCNDGFLRTLGQSTRSLDGTASIPYNVQSPYVNYDLPSRKKTLEGASICFNPKGPATVTFGWQRDGQVQQTDTLVQGDAVGVLDAFVLDTDVLGGRRFQEVFARLGEMGGEFRAIQYQMRNNRAGDDIEIHSFSCGITPGAEAWTND